MLTSILWKTLSVIQKEQLLKRPLKNNSDDFMQQVKSIIERVRTDGDVACKNMTLLYDGVSINSFNVEESEFKNASNTISLKTKQAIIKASKQIEAFHMPQLLKNNRVETTEGIVCETLQRPIQRVGLYVPGGSAPLVSTVLMLGIPAKIANCPIRILCTPPQKNGTIDPALLFAAELCGIKNIYKLGGAQAIAAMAYGTQTIPQVDKIFGPGNAWVTLAKMLVAQDQSGALYDLPAGPSEVMVIADSTANAQFIAADLLSQAEHGNDSQVMLVCTDHTLSIKISDAIKEQIKSLTRRTMIENTLKNSCLILVENLSEAVLIANQYAPEHLMLQVNDSRKLLESIYNAGSVFLGPWSASTAGDYASGTNHVLPTNGYARSLSGLSVRDFMKTITVQELSKKGLSSIAETMRELTTIEGLEAHQRAVDIRLGEMVYAE